MIIRPIIFAMLASMAFAAASHAQDTRNLLESKESLYNNIYV
jgi:spermidine synthase